MPVPAALRRLLAERDQRRCVYCLTTEENCRLQMHVDHIIPETAGGTTTADNLCLVCFSCSVHKGARQTGIDPLTGETAPLFHPLRQRWQDHFAWDENNTQIVGLTPCGRATVATLQMNNLTIVRAPSVGQRWLASA